MDKLIVDNSGNKYSRRHTPSDGNISIMINGSNIHINAATTGGQWSRILAPWSPPTQFWHPCFRCQTNSWLLGVTGYEKVHTLCLWPGKRRLCMAIFRRNKELQGMKRQEQVKVYFYGVGRLSYHLSYYYGQMRIMWQITSQSACRGTFVRYFWNIQSISFRRSVHPGRVAGPRFRQGKSRQDPPP